MTGKDSAGLYPRRLYIQSFYIEIIKQPKHKGVFIVNPFLEKHLEISKKFVMYQLQNKSNDYYSILLEHTTNLAFCAMKLFECSFMDNREEYSKYFQQYLTNTHNVITVFLENEHEIKGSSEFIKIMHELSLAQTNLLKDISETAGQVIPVETTTIQ